MAFGAKQFNCQMSCDHELANEGARCSGRNASYITVKGIMSVTKTIDMSSKVIIIS